MLKFSLEDLTLEGLRKLADTYGIPKTKTAREDLLAALKERMADRAQIVVGEPPKPWFRTPSIIVAILALLVASAGWYTAYHTVTKDNEGRRQDKKIEWQRAIVFKIIQENTKTAPHTIDFEAIRSKYVAEAQSSNVVELNKEELQPLELHRILVELIALNTVYLTIEDKYCVQRTSTNQRAERVFVEENAQYAILHELSNEGGKHTVASLFPIINTKTGITYEEYTANLNALTSRNLVIVDEAHKLWSLTNAPRKKP